MSTIKEAISLDIQRSKEVRGAVRLVLLDEDENRVSFSFPPEHILDFIHSILTAHIYEDPNTPSANGSTSK